MSAADMIEKLPATVSPLYTIEHVMLFTFRSNDYVTATLAGLNSLASLPEVIYLHAGPILRARSYWPEPETFTHLLHARFPALDAFRTFRSRPEFVAVVGELMMANVTNVVTAEWFWFPDFGPKILPPGRAVNLSLFKFKGDKLRRWMGERYLYSRLVEMKRESVLKKKPLTYGIELWGLTESGAPYSVGLVSVLGKRDVELEFDHLTSLFGETNERDFEYLMRNLVLDVGKEEYGIGIKKVVSVDYIVPVHKKPKASNVFFSAILPFFSLVGLMMMKS